LSKKKDTSKGKGPDKWMGFSKGDVKDSIFWSYFSVCAVCGENIPDSTQELRIKASNHTKGEILGIKLKDMKFNNNNMAYM
jgi:hypothetical protein